MQNTLSLELKGEVTLSDFAKAMNHFTTLITELTEDIGENAEIEWEIAKLESGSATAVVIGRSQDAIAVDKVVQAYEVIGQALINKKPIPYSETIAQEARSITSVINGKIKSVIFRTEEFEASINDSQVNRDDDEEKGFSIGTVTGRVETLSKRGRMRFVLYDTIFDRAVSCYLAKDQEHLMLDAWDKKITAAGKVYRDPISGRPYKIADVNYIEVKKVPPPGSFMKVQGIIPWKEGDEYPEEVIRRYRNEQ